MKSIVTSLVLVAAVLANVAMVGTASADSCQNGSLSRYGVWDCR